MKSKLLFQILSATAICAILVMICYFYVDKAVAEFAELYTVPSEQWFKWIAYIPPLLLMASAILFFPLIIIYDFTGKFSRLSKILLLITINTLLTNSIKDELKFIFGRYWPETWVNNNPSWIGTHSYGFHFFHSGIIYQSFPSGHVALIFAAMSIVWLKYPNLRWLAALSCLAVMFCMVGMNQHFVSDVIAGAFLGTITGKLMCSLSDKISLVDSIEPFITPSKAT